MSTQEVCRLCLSKQNLLCVFDRLFETDYLKDVIYITTGVEIHTEDVISQKICTKCGQDAIKMYQFRKKSLKIDKYLKEQCRKKQEPRCVPSYRVHPTVTALSRKYPMLHLPSICVLFNVDPHVSLEMDTVENYFRSRNLNMKKYAQLALTESDKNIPKNTWTITKSLEKYSEYSVKPRKTDHVAQSTSTAISETVDNAEVVNKVRPINIKLNESGYSIVRPSSENIIHGKIKNVCESSCEQLVTDSPESESGIRKPKKRRLSDSDFSSEPATKKISPANPSKMISVLSNIEIRSPTVYKCNICGSIQLSAKQLERHQTRHSRCKFCKTQFRSVGMKQQHIDNSCFVKEALNNLPYVEIRRTDLNIRLHHQDASTISSPPGLEMDSSPISSTIAEEIIEIISDDEDTYTPTSNALPTKPILSKNSALTPSTVTNKNPALTVIKPVVRMKNDNILDALETPAPDFEILKELLTKSKSVRSVTDADTQTELPTTESIRVDENNFAVELINLKPVLHPYLIPVEIKKGTKISAYYNYQRSHLEPKIPKLWNDLTPIDVEAENNPNSEQTANVEHMITVTPTTHSNIITNDATLVSRSESCDSSNNDQTSSQNIGIVTPASLNGSTLSSNSLQTKSPAITPTQIESPNPTPGCVSVSQAEPLATIPSQLPFTTETQTRKQLLVSPQALEIVPNQATSPITAIPNRRYSPTSPEQSVYSNPRRRSSSGADQTTLQNNSVVIPTNCDLCYVDSNTPRKSAVQNQTDVNANWDLLNYLSEVVETRHDSITSTIECVVNNHAKSVDTSTVNVHPPNGEIFSNNNQQLPHISQERPKSTMIQWSQNVHQPSQTTNCHNMNVPDTVNSYLSYQNFFSNKAPIQKIASDNNVCLNPPVPYPNDSTLVNKMPQSYIPSHTSNIPQADYTAKTVQTVDGNYDAFLQEFLSFQGMVESVATCMSNAHHRETNHSTASKLRKVGPCPRVSESFSCQGNQSSLRFPPYSKANNYVNGSITVSPVKHNFDVSNGQLPKTCPYQPVPVAGNTLTNSVPAVDKSQHFLPGLIRVRSVSELT